MPVPRRQRGCRRSKGAKDTLEVLFIEAYTLSSTRICRFYCLLVPYLFLSLASARACTLTTGASFLMKFMALPIRFCNSCRICSWSAYGLAARPTSTRPLPDLCAPPSGETTFDQLVKVYRREGLSPGRNPREGGKRCSRFCIWRCGALHPLQVASRPARLGHSPYLALRRSLKVRTWRSWPCRSCEACISLEAHGYSGLPCCFQVFRGPLIPP